jgi:hypothetical protein
MRKPLKPAQASLRANLGARGRGQVATFGNGMRGTRGDEPRELRFEGKPLKGEPQECFRDEISSERIGRKNARDGGEKPRTWAVPEGGTSGDVADRSHGAEGDQNPRRGASAWKGRRQGGREDPVEG